MSSLRPFHPLDLFSFNLTNLDPLTETYDVQFYLSYLAKWPSLFTVVEGRDPDCRGIGSRGPGKDGKEGGCRGRVEAYIMGKLESTPTLPHLPPTSPHYLPWHAHITALTVSPGVRRLGLARQLTASLERAGDEYNAWFVDLFVRESNQKARGMYGGWGYSVFRRVTNYYSDTLESHHRKKPDPPSDSRAKKKHRRGGRDDDEDGEAGEDAFDMRKPLKRDKNRKYVRADGRGEEVRVRPEDVW